MLALAALGAFAFPISGVSLHELPGPEGLNILPELLILMIGPVPLAICAAWWSGRWVAGQYAHKVAVGTGELSSSNL